MSTITKTKIRVIRNSVKYEGFVLEQTTTFRELDRNLGRSKEYTNTIHHLEDICVDGAEIERNTIKWSSVRAIMLKAYKSGDNSFRPDPRDHADGHVQPSEEPNDSR